MSSTRQTAILLKLDEPSDGVQPTDAAGNLADMTVPAGLSRPTVVDARVGRGRLFGAGKAFKASELVAGSTRLTRSMSIEAIVNYDNGRLTNGTRTIIARGLTGSSAETRLWGLHVITSGAPSSPVHSLQMFWDGLVVPSFSFAMPSGYLYLAAVRRCLDAGLPTVSEVSYFVNGLQIGSVAVAGTLENGEGGTVTLGARYSGSAWENHWLDTIDEVRVSNVARTPEEIAQTFKAVFVYPAQGYETIRALLPPGEAYSKDPSSAIQRELMVEGDGLGKVMGAVGELLDDFLPDRATRSLERWEALTRLSPRPGDSIDQRRGRVVAFLRKIHGFNRDQIRLALEDILDCDGDDLEILEVSNRFSDPFVGGTIGGAWYQVPNQGTLAQSGGLLNITSQAGDDGRWETGVNNSVAMRTSVRDGHSPSVDAFVDAQVIANVSSVNLLDDGDAAGIFFTNGIQGDFVLFGVIRRGGVLRLFRATFLGGDFQETLLAGTPPSSDFFLRIRNGVDNETTVDWNVEPDGTIDGPWLNLDVFEGTLRYNGGQSGPQDLHPWEPNWSGVFVKRGTSPAATDASMSVKTFLSYVPKTDNVFKWFVYRNPALGGDPDIRGAELVVNKIQPAHTRGLVCESKVALCDDEFSLCDRDPVGS